jgi:hypothetical protein
VQLSLSVVSAIILSFAAAASMQGTATTNVSTYFTLFGVITSFISTFFAYGYVKVARKVLVGNRSIGKDNVRGTLLRSISLNLWGIGATLVGLQAVIGVLVAKTLTASSTNPYAPGGVATRSAAPAALDVFSVQASANTLLAHFASIVFANWLLRTLNHNAPAAKVTGSAPQPPPPQLQGKTIWPKPV